MAIATVLILAVLVLGFIALIMGLFRSAGSHRRAIQNAEELKQHGTRVMARVIKIVDKGRYKLFKNPNGTFFLLPDTTDHPVVRGEPCTAYVIEAHWLHEERDIMYDFHSHLIPHKPKIAVGDPIPVVINMDDPSIYKMELPDDI